MKYLILVIIALDVLLIETSAQNKTPIINKREVKRLNFSISKVLQIIKFCIKSCFVSYQLIM